MPREAADRIEQILIEFMDYESDDFYGFARPILEAYTQEVERAALERAAKALCSRCERGQPIDEDGDHFYRGESGRLLALIPKPSGSCVDVGPETGGEDR